MKHKILLYILLALSSAVVGQTPNQLIMNVNSKFGKVQNYSALINMVFDIPGVTMQPVNGKVYYKKPNKFRIKSKGIAFVPKQNPYLAMANLSDSSSFVAVEAGREIVRGIQCRVINVIPNVQGDLVLGKFWVDPKGLLILKSQVTTKTNGTINLENYFSKNASQALPDKMIISIDVAKFKLPKALTVDINSKAKAKSKSDRGTGIIQMNFSNYLVNAKIDEKVFSEKLAN